MFKDRILCCAIKTHPQEAWCGDSGTPPRPASVPAEACRGGRSQHKHYPTPRKRQDRKPDTDVIRRGRGTENAPLGVDRRSRKAVVGAASIRAVTRRINIIMSRR